MQNFCSEHPRKINCSCTNIPKSPDSSISDSVHFSINHPQPECQHFTLSRVQSTENLDKRLYPSVKVLDADNSSLSDASCGCDSPCKTPKRTCHCNQQLVNYGHFNGCHSCGPSTPYTYSTQQHYEFGYQNFHHNTYEYQQFNVEKVTADFTNALSVNVRTWSDSSINICVDRTTSIDLPPLTWNGYDCDPSCLTAAHTGKTLLINGNWCGSRPYIQGGPLNGTYIFSQIHFHTPSEHSFEGKRFPLEMHVVHYKTNYLTQERAMKEKDGTLVLVYLFDVSDCCESTSFACIAEVAQCLIKPHSTKDIPPMSLDNLMCSFSSNYYFYMGTVGAHKETYLLQVVVNCKASDIPRNELKELLSILKSGSGSAHHLSKMRPQNDSIFHVGTEVEDVCASTSKPAGTQYSKSSIIQETVCSRSTPKGSRGSQRRHRFRFNTVSAPSVCQSLDENFSQTSMPRRREEYRQTREEARRERREENRRRKCLKRMTKMENRCRRQLRKREGFLGCKTKAKRQECLRYYIKTKRLQQRCSQHSKLGECTESCVKRELLRRQDDPSKRIRRDDTGKEVAWKNSEEGCELVAVESTTSKVECDEDSTSASASASASASTSQKQSADESSQDNDYHKESPDKTEPRRSVDKTVSIDEAKKYNDNAPKSDSKGSVERCTETVCVRKKSTEDCCEGDFVRDILMDDDEDLEDEEFLTHPIFQDCVRAQMCKRRRARKKWRTKCSLCKSKRCRNKHCCTQKILPNASVRAIDAPPFIPAEIKTFDKKGHEIKDLDKKESDRREVDRKECDRRESDRREADRRELDRKESERREADRRESDRKEADRRELDRRESERREAERRESVRREAEKREAERRESERRESVRRESERRESERRESERREAQRRESERKEAERRESERRESERKEADRKEADRKEADRKEAERKEAERREAERRESIRKEPDRRESDRRESDRREPDKGELDRRDSSKKDLDRRDSERRLSEKKQRELERRELEKKDAARREKERREAERRAVLRREAERKEAERKKAEKKEAERREAERKKAEKPKDKRSFWNFDIFKRLDKNKERSKSNDNANKKHIMPTKDPKQAEKKVEPKKPAKDDDDDAFDIDDAKPDKNVIVHYMISPNEEKEKFSNENLKVDKNVTPNLAESSSSQSSFIKYGTPPESLLGESPKPPSKENRVTFNINLDSASNSKRDDNTLKQKTELHPNKLLNKKDATFRNSFPPYFSDSFGCNKSILPTFMVTSKSNFISESLVEKPPLISTGTQCSVNKIFCKRTSLAEKIAINREKGLLKTEFEDKKECYIKLIKNPELKESLKQKDIDKLDVPSIDKAEEDSPKSKKKKKYFVVDKIEKDHRTGKKILVGCFRTKEELLVIREMAKQRINGKETDAQKENELDRKESLCEREICIKKFDIEKKKSGDRKENFLARQPSLKKMIIERKKSLEDKDLRKREFILKNLDEQKIGILIKKDAIRKKKLERKDSTNKSNSSIRTAEVEQEESAPKKTVSWKSVAVDKKRSFGRREGSIEKESRLNKSESEQKKSLRNRDPSVKTAETEKRKRGDKRDFSLKRLDPEKKESLVKRTDSGRKESSAKREYSLKRVDSDKRKEIKVIKSPKVEEVPKKSVVKSPDIALKKDDLEKKKGGIKGENLNKKEDFCPSEKRKILGKRDPSVKRTDVENKKNIDKKDELSKKGEVAKVKDAEKKKSLIKRENSLKRKNSSKKTNVEEEKNTEAKESKQNDKIKTKGKKKLSNAETSEDKEKDKTTHKKRNSDKSENIDLVKKYSDFDEEEENSANLGQILGAAKKEQVKSETSKETKVCFERNQDFDEKEHLEILEYLKNQIEKADSTDIGKELNQKEIIEICEETERKTNFKKEECSKESKFKNSKTRISMADLKSIEKIIELSKIENIKTEEKTENKNLATKYKSMERKDLEIENLAIKCKSLEIKNLERDNLATETKNKERKEIESLTTKSKSTERKELEKEYFATTNKSIERKGLEKDNLATKCSSTERSESEKESLTSKSKSTESKELGNLAIKCKSMERKRLEKDIVATKSKSTESKELEKENLARKTQSTERKELEKENLITKNKNMERKESEKENLAITGKSIERKELEKEIISLKSKITEKKELEKESLATKIKGTEIKELEKNIFAPKNKNMERKELEIDLVIPSNSSEEKEVDKKCLVTANKSPEKEEPEKENLATACKITKSKEAGKEYLATVSKSTERKEMEKGNAFKEYENTKDEDVPSKEEKSKYNGDSNKEEEDLCETGNLGNIIDVKEKSMNKINDIVTAQNSKSGYVKDEVDQDKVKNIESKGWMESNKASPKVLEGKNFVVKKSQNLINGEELVMKNNNLSEREVNENSSELGSKKSVKDDEGTGKNYELQNRTSKTEERKEMDVTYKNLDRKQSLSTTSSTYKKCDLDGKTDIGKSENSNETNDLDEEKNIDTDIKIIVEKKVIEEQNNLNQNTKLNSAESKEKVECFGSIQDIKKKNAEYKAEEEIKYISIHEKIDEEINEEKPIVDKEEVVKEVIVEEDLDNVGSKKKEKNLKTRDNVELKMSKTQKADLEESEKSAHCVNSLFRAQIPSTSVSETSQTPKKSFSIKVLKPQKLISDLSQDSLDESFTKKSSCLSKMSMFHQEDLEKKKANTKKEINISTSNKGTFETEKVSDTTLRSKGNDEKDQLSVKPKSLENSEKDSYSNKSSLGETSDKEIRVLHKFRPKEKMKKAKTKEKEQIVEKVLEKIRNSEADHPNLGEILGINKENPKISVCEMEMSDHSGASSTTKEISQTEQSSKQFSAKNSVYSPQILDSKETSKTKLGLPFEKVDSQAAIIIIPIEVNSLSNIELLVVEKIKQSLQNVEKKEVKQSGETSENNIGKASAEFVPQDAATENKKEEKEKSKEKEELDNGRDGGSVKNCVVAPQTPQNNETDVNEVDLENEYKFESNSYNRSLFEFPLFLLIFNSHSSNFLNFSHIYSSFLHSLTIF